VYADLSPWGMIFSFHSSLGNPVKKSIDRSID